MTTPITPELLAEIKRLDECATKGPWYTVGDPWLPRDQERDPGRCYRKAGWQHVGFTEGGLYALQQLPGAMPPAAMPHGAQMSLFSPA